MQDPKFVASSFLAQRNPEDAGFVVLVLMIGAVVAFVSPVLVVSFLHKRARRNEFRFEVSPQYRKP